MCSSYISMTKPTKWHVRPAKTQISLGIRSVWSEFSLWVQWVAKDPSFLHADSKDSDQTEWMPRLNLVFAGRTCRFVGFFMCLPVHDKTYNKTCVTSKDSVQPVHLPGMIRLGLSLCRRNMRLAKTLVRLRGCAGWSESSLVARLIVGFVVCWFICCCTTDKVINIESKSAWFTIYM